SRFAQFVYRMDKLSPPLTLIMSCHIRATNGRFGLVICSHCVDPVTGASNRKKRSVAIAVTSASTVGLLIQGIRPIAETKFCSQGARGDMKKSSMPGNATRVRKARQLIDQRNFSPERL